MSTRTYLNERYSLLVGYLTDKPTMGPVVSRSCGMVLLHVGLVVLPPTAHAALTQQHPAIREVVGGSIDDPATSLTYFVYASLTPDSLLLLSEVFEDHIRILDWQARPRRIIGRRGEGPGEFTNLGRVGPIGRTGHIWAHDAGQQRISVFDTSGLRIREISVRSLNIASYLGVLPGDTLIVYRPVTLTTFELLVVDGKSLRTFTSLARYVETGSSIRIVAPGGRITTTSPFRDGPLITASPDGTQVLLVDRKAATSGQTASFTVTVFRPNGSRRQQSFNYRPRPVDNAAVDDAVDQLARISSTGPTSFARRLPREVLRAAIRDSLKVPRYLSPVSAALISSDGRVWLRREVVGLTARWEVLSRDLRQIEASFELPASAEARVAEHDRLWVLEQDEFDVPYVVRYRIPAEASSRR